ncbi:MAG: histidinol-phosphatase [Candidatus Pacearchaeota archaeon]|jgi:histidinol-phosphatase (PHP family)
MIKINHHLHSTGSDGTLSPEEVIKLAIKKDLSFICFTDHYPFPPGYKEWGRDFQSEEYYNDIIRLIKKYKDKIEISYGAEFNWVESFVDWTNEEIKKRPYDYVLGSIHEIKKDNILYNLWPGDGNLENILNDFKSFDNFAKEYMRQIKMLISSKLFDGIGHFDLLKIYDSKISSDLENNASYRKDVIECLDLVKKNDMIIEINTGGFRRPCNEQYPSFWILQEMNKRNIPITIGIDSHYEDQMDNNYSEAIDLAKKAGYTSIVKFKNRKRIEITI